MSPPKSTSKRLLAGTPKRMKMLDYQALTFGHPALDIWSIVYSATDAEYRAHGLEEDLQAYFAILAGYMKEEVDYTEFRQELEERRVMAMVMYGRSCFPSTSTSEFGRYLK